MARCGSMGRWGERETLRGETREGEGGGLTSPWMTPRRTRISPERHGARRPSRAAARRFAGMPLSSDRTPWRAASSTSRPSPSFAAPATELMMYAEKMKRTRREFPCLPRQRARRGAPLSGPKRPWRSSSLSPEALPSTSRVDGGHLVCLSAPPAARSETVRLLRPSTFFEPPGSYGIRGISSLSRKRCLRFF